jgi:aminobenzoyl-glutamate utilization protein B
VQRALDALGPVPFDDADRAFAQAIRQTLNEGDIAATFRRIGRTPDFDLPLCDFVAPLDRPSQGGEGSTDVGDVSWAVPTVQARVATCAIGTPLHTWQQTAQGKSPMAHKGMVHAAKIMAATARILIDEEATLAAVKKAHRQQLERTPYICPIPDDLSPPLPREVA